MNRTLALTSKDRLLVLAPHPDDESVATGGLLQHAVEVGSEVLILFFTDGDNNPWAQRASELRWTISAVDRARFAVRRRREARRALEKLGVRQESATFLGFPDQAATDLLVHGNDVALRALGDVLLEWRPTVVAGPSFLDLHPDHSALAVLMCLALDGMRGALAPRHHLRFVVHNPKLLARPDPAISLPLTEVQRVRKRAAIACHRTQFVLRSTWLLSFARGAESFYLEESATGEAQHPVRCAACDGPVLEIAVSSRTLLRSFGSRTLCLVGGPPGDPVRLAVALPEKTGRAEVRDLRTGATVDEAEFRGRRGTGKVRIATSLLRDSPRLFAKLERAFGFFDEAGWKELRRMRSEARPGTDCLSRAD